ncbi:hypothetical protein AB5I41_06835 [Sphingomonas sp. MMS24-JH45]
MIAIDGKLDDWTGPRIASTATRRRATRSTGRADGSDFVFALKAAETIGANTTFWFNTDRNTATGFQIFGFAGGAEYNVNVDSAGKVALFWRRTRRWCSPTSRRPGRRTAASSNSACPRPRSATRRRSTPSSTSTTRPSCRAALPAPATPCSTTPGSPSTRRSGSRSSGPKSTAKNYFSESTAYTQLFLAAQSQAMQAGVPFDILTESDLTNLATVAKYDTIVFPSFRNVDASLATKISQTLEQATKQMASAWLRAASSMTNDATGAALAGDSYARMKLLFDATRVTGGTGDVTLTASDAAGLVLDGYDNGHVIRQYTGVGWNAFESVSGKEHHRHRDHRRAATPRRWRRRRAGATSCSRPRR